MGVPISLKISGLTCGLTHGPSNAVLGTTPPKDNGGDGSTFSPTDLLAASLASCALTTMALQAGRENLSWGDASARVVKEMTPTAPRRVAELTLEVGIAPDLENWILGWGSHAIVLEPAELREQIASTARAMALNYTGQRKSL
jgi:uncharacterized OsmC-like protein